MTKCSRSGAASQARSRLSAPWALHSTAFCQDSPVCARTLRPLTWSVPCARALLLRHCSKVNAR